jgi:heptosyltransferase-3
LKKKVFEFFRDSRPQRVLWWILTIFLFPLLFIRMVVDRFPSGRSSSMQRILVIQLGGIGDTLMMTPALTILKRQYPSAEIDLALTHQYVKDAFEIHPYFRRIIPMEYSIKGYGSLRKVSGRWMGVLKALYYFPLLFLKLAFRRYDTAVVCGLSPEMKNLGGALTYALGIPLRIGFGKKDHGFLHRSLTVNHSKDHRVNLYVALMQFLGVVESGPHQGQQYVFPIAEEERAWAQRFIETSHRGQRPRLAMHPGGADLIVPRRWPSDYFVKVGQWFIKATGGMVLLTGGVDDTELCGHVEADLGRQVINACGQYSVRESAALLAQCDICLTNDTSVLHLALAVGVPNIVAIFGPTDPNLLVPKGCNTVRYLQGDLSCTPCAGSVLNSETHKCRRPLEGECLYGVNPAQVIQVLQEILVDTFRKDVEITTTCSEMA